MVVNDDLEAALSELQRIVDGELVNARAGR